MSNLGLYQSMTTWAKKLGGPLQLGCVVAIGGYVVIRTVEAGGKTVVKAIKKHVKTKGKAPTATYVVHSEGKSNEGLIFAVGDKFNVLEIADDTVLIEKIGDNSNPYFVSADLLHSISDFNG